jgi:hypothetical protein
MRGLQIFLIRLGLAVVLAYFICRVFFEGASALRVVSLAAAMLLLAYLFEFTKKRGGTHGNPQ